MLPELKAKKVLALSRMGFGIVGQSQSKFSSKDPHQLFFFSFGVSGM